ncbi:hypothetical protein BH10ACI4_BH10ACI4_11680 [soil metagenome]
MRVIIATLLSFSLLFTTVISPQLAHAQGPVLLTASFSSHTNDEDKDHDTGIYVDVMSQDGSSKLAHADNRDNSGDDGTQYKDGSDHSFALDVDSAGLAKDSAKGFKGTVCIHTHGNDTWRFRGNITLHFSDSSNITANIDNTELKNDGACLTFSAPSN